MRFGDVQRPTRCAAYGDGARCRSCVRSTSTKSGAVRTRTRRPRWSSSSAACAWRRSAVGKGSRRVDGGVSSPPEASRSIKLTASSQRRRLVSRRVSQPAIPVTFRWTVSRLSTGRWAGERQGRHRQPGPLLRLAAGAARLRRVPDHEGRRCGRPARRVMRRPHRGAARPARPGPVADWRLAGAGRARPRSLAWSRCGIAMRDRSTKRVRTVHGVATSRRRP